MIFRLLIVLSLLIGVTYASDEILDQSLSPQGKIILDRETTCHPMRCVLAVPGVMLGATGSLIGCGVGAFLVGPYTLCTRGYYFKAIMDCTLGGAHIGWELGHGKCS